MIGRSDRRINFSELPKFNCDRLNVTGGEPVRAVPSDRHGRMPQSGGGSQPTHGVTGYPACPALRLAGPGPGARRRFTAGPRPGTRGWAISESVLPVRSDLGE